MARYDKDRMVYLLIGVIIGLLFGIVMTSIGGLLAYKILKSSKSDLRHAVTSLASSVKPKPANVKEAFHIGFESEDDVKMLDISESTLVELSEANATEGRKSLLVKILPGSGFPGIGWETFGSKTRDWSGMDNFHLDIYNNTEDNIPLNIKFKSGRKYPKKSFTYSVRLSPLELNSIDIPTETIGSRCNIREMSYFKCFVQSPKKEIVLYLDNIGDVSAGGKKASADKAGNDIKEARIEKNGIPATYNVITGSSLNKFFHDGKALLQPEMSSEASVSLARNEYESFQIVIGNGKEELKDVYVETADLKSEETGSRISSDNIEIFTVGYVPTKKPYYPVKFVGYWPDPLMPGKGKDIQPGFTQSFWATIYAPKDAIAGNYSGIFRVKSENKVLKEVPVNVRVYDFTLPDKSALTTAFDLYPHITPKRYPRRESESEEEYKRRMKRLNDKYYVDMLKHRLNPIINVDPRSREDLARVERYRYYGLNSFSVGKKGGTFNNNWPKTDEEIEKLLPLYRSYGETLKINGLIDYNYIYTWDEGDIGNPLVPKICSMIHRAYPALRNMVCYHGFWDPNEHPGWGKDIDIWCFGIGDYDERAAKALRDYGMELWMYISGPGGSGEPNLAIDYDSIDYRIVPWLCRKFEIEGFLYWCVNWWPYVDPFESTANTKWNQNGNGLLYYPGEDGPLASLRIKVYRDGMEDYEYFELLSQKLKQMSDKGLNELNKDVFLKASNLLFIDSSIASSMRSFTKNPDVLTERRDNIALMIERIDDILGTESDLEKKSVKQVAENFKAPMKAENGKVFGEYGQLTFELYRGGTFLIDGTSHVAWQRSDDYRDVAIIRSTKELPNTYKVTAVVGNIDYPLKKIEFLEDDPEYSEGPKNENGCYLLAITDTNPRGHHTNDWWHEHRKVCIDVDNNVWGHGMPRPVFMVYFDKQNKLMAYDGEKDAWGRAWENAITYDPAAWYIVQIEKTENEYILSIFDVDGNVMEQSRVEHSEVWHAQDSPDYLVIGDPHENYYRGSMQVYSVGMSVELPE
jgi:hypothetical protein